MKKSILGILLLCSTPSLLPVTTGLTCLYNPETKQKVAILYDNYSGYKGSPDLVANQVKELTSLVDALASRKSSSTVLCDCSAFTFSALQKGAHSDEVLLTIPKIFAAQGNSTKGNTSFDIFGNWNNNQPDRIVKTWYLDSNTLDILDMAEVHSPILHPEPTYQKLTVGLYLDHLKESYNNSVRLLDKLPVRYAQLAKQIKAKLAELYNELGTSIQESLAQSPFTNINELHVIYLLESQLRKWNYDLLQKISKLVAYQEAIDLLSQVVGDSSKNIVLHCRMLPLLTYWLDQVGFEIVDDCGQYVLTGSEDEALALSICTPANEDLPRVEEDSYVVELDALFDVGQLVLNFLG